MTDERVRLDLGMLFPELRDLNDECVVRLMRLLRGTTGIGEVHVVDGDVPEAASLCLHFDPAVLSLVEVERLARSSGARAREGWGGGESTRTRPENP